MKKLIVIIFSVVLLGGCSYTSYQGTLIFPENVMFDKPNFKYITTIEGSATAEWTGFWISRHEKVNGLINEAKKNMYKNHVFSPNQIITNLTKDVVRTTGGDGGKNRLHAKVIMSGDIYEFSNNNIYSGHQKVEKPEGLDVINEKIINSTSTKKETIEVNSNSSYFKYSKTPELNDVVYYIDYYTKEYIKGKIIKLSKNSSSVLVLYLTKNGGNKKRYIEIDLLFQKW